MDDAVTPQALRRDAVVAMALALVLGLGWTLRDWADVSALHLPDTDDVMRLQQIRDWLDGQRFADLTQHRLGLGMPMHWSRLADLVPAGGIAALTPLVGRPEAEIVTVALWPIMLFAVALLLAGRIARAAGTSARTAIVVAAIAYPATTIFLPGRIDHHGLQLVFLLGATCALTGRDRVRRGAAAGLLAAASVVVGLETAPLFAVIGATMVIDWVLRGAAARRRLIGMGFATLVGLSVGRLVFASDAWSYPACDGFTADAWRAGMTGAAALVLLAVVRPRTRIARLVAASVVGAITIATAVVIAPRCLSPYGGVDPLLAHVWLAHVAEAQPLFHADAATAIGYGGLLVAGIAATGWQLHRSPTRIWAILLALQLAALAVTCVQLRGAYAGAMLAAPALAALIGRARGHGPLALAAAWIGSAGMLYPIAAAALAPTPPRAGAGGADCLSPALRTALAGLPSGVVMAPIDVGAYAIAATHHRLVAAPYHRNAAGNLAMYRYYGNGPAQAARIARAWHVDYTVACAQMPARGARGSMAAALADGRSGLRILARTDDGAAIYAAHR